MTFLSSCTESKPSTRRIVFWNAAGSLCAALSSFFYLFIVTRICGSEVAGNYSIGLAIAQLMWTIGVFEATTYFATDAKGRFSSEQYFGFKILTCLAMAVISFVYVLSFLFDAQKTALALWLCALKLVDAFGMYYFAAFQKVGRLDISGFSSVWQVLVSVISFSVVIILGHDVIDAVIAATLSKAAWIAIYNTTRMKAICPITGPDFSWSAMKSLFIELLPLFFATYLANYLSNLPKYSIELMGTADMQAKFSIIFMPSFVINLFLIFVMRPMLTPLAEKWAAGNTASFKSITIKILAAVTAMTATVLVGSYLVGIPVLSFVFKIDLSEALWPLMIVMLGGGLASASNVLYNDIIILRRQRLVVLAYGAAVVTTWIVASPLVRYLGLTGAALAYLIASTVLLVVYTIVCLIAIRDYKKQRASI